MIPVSHRSRAGSSLSYGERAAAHWRSLNATHKKRILLYLAWRLVRYARRALTELGKALIIEALDWIRLGRAYLVLFAASLLKLGRELSSEQARREYSEVVDAFRTGRFLRDSWLLVFLIGFAMIASMPRQLNGPTIVEQARMVRNHPPPPCVSDGDGGVWIDVGSRYVKQRDADYARLRQTLCGY